MTSKIKSFGRLQVQVDWGRETWYYINQQNEKINMGFFIGSVEFEDAKLYQFILGPLMISWGWRS